MAEREVTCPRCGLKVKLTGTSRCPRCNFFLLHAADCSGCGKCLKK
ncbi:MAG: hypothetical protein H0Z35_00020 [Thermoanaerobacteraceae bacterium]|nr:hypothetical protein [Thermoanaerobacteraceae bacterium]